MTAAHRFMKFWPQDWQRDPALRMCSLEARALWLEMLCMAHDAEPYGHVAVSSRAATIAEMGVVAGCNPRRLPRLLAELEQNKVFDRTPEGIIFSRRMVRDFEVSQAGREFVGRRADRQNSSPKGQDWGKAPASPPTTQESYSEAESEAESIPLQSRKRDGLPLAGEPVPKPTKSRPEGDSPAFAAFWEAYPRKAGKGAARTAWVRALTKATAAEIMAGLERHQFDTRPEYRPHPATWLNQERWADEASANAPSRDRGSFF